MPRYSNSDEEDETVAPPLTFASADPEIYEHLVRHLVADAKTGDRVDGSTVLASVFTDPALIRNPTLLRSLTRIAEPKIPCQVRISRGRVFPPRFDSRTNSYSIKVTFNRLVIAPVVRLEVEFFDPQDLGRTPYHTLTLEFHFNDYSEHDDGEAQDMKIKDFVYLTSQMRYSAGRATCSGFNSLQKFEHKFTTADRDIIQFLKSFTLLRERGDIVIDLHYNGMDPHDREALAAIRSRLPGGSGRLLNSIGIVEYEAFGEGTDHIWSKGGGMRRPRTLLAAAMPFPQVSLESSTAFATVKAAQVELGYSAEFKNSEDREALMLWAEPRRDCVLFLLEKFAVLGLKTTKHERLRSCDDAVDFKLPRDLYCEFNGLTDTLVSGVLMSSPPRSIDPKDYDAFFQITSHTPKHFDKTYAVGDSKPFRSLQCKPHYSSFTYNSQMETIHQLCQPVNKRWRPILLNQLHDSLEWEDMTRKANKRKQHEVDAWLQGVVPWNEEQKKVIEGIRKALGGMMLVMGPAATGKTLLQRFLILYFYYLGYHVLAVAPANDNVNKLAKDLDEYLETTEARIKKDKNLEDKRFSFLRLFPSSRDIMPEELDEEQAKNRRVGHESGKVLNLREFCIALDEQKKEKVDHRKHGVAETIIRQADEKKITLYTTLKSGGKLLRPNQANAYNVLREFMDIHRRRQVDWSDKEIPVYKAAYEACKSALVAKNRIMITTNGNVQAQELTADWFGSPGFQCPEKRGVIIIGDEAAKDFEINVWSSIVCGKWAAFVVGVLLFGDNRQLQPPNNCAKGKVMFNPFRDRLDIALLTRLVEEHFPAYILHQQRRMHPVLSKFPNRVTYRGNMRDAPDMNTTIDQDMPGLRQVLVDIIADTISSPSDREDFKATVTDDDLRRHYVEVSGTREVNPVTKSKNVHEHVNVFFNKIYPKLRRYFRETKQSMEKNVMIICAYGWAVAEYKKRLQEIRDKDKYLTADDIPRVVTIDSSQGDESFMVFFDASAQYCNELGFMQNAHRCNVAITRAKGVLWTVGGSMKMHPWKTRESAHNLPSQYKAELDDTGTQKHRFLQT